MKSRCIRGIPCCLQTAAARRNLGKVLDRIKSAQPEDFARLLRVVREVAPLAPEETEDGTMGKWKADQLQGNDPATWGDSSTEAPGILYIDEGLLTSDLIAVMAHELGHACTVENDLEARGPSLEDEWASELTTLWYAIKRWGFRREMDSIRPKLARLHHGPWPGEEWATELGWIRIDDDYVCHDLP